MPWGWGYVEGDEQVHVATLNGTTLCEPKAYARCSKVVLVCVAADGVVTPPKVVTCEGCLAAGAVNYEEPAEGWTGPVYYPLVRADDG